MRECNTMAATVLSLLLWLTILQWSVGIETFSGLYSANTKKGNSAEDFAAAWLVTRERFLASKKFIEGSTNMAGVSFAITRAKCAGCYTMLSRDYFDFLVEHLSTTSNQIPNSNKSIFQIYYKRIRKVVGDLRILATDRTETDPRLQETIATLIYSSITFSRPQADEQANIREPYFEATFWSVHRFIPNVIVFVASDHDREAVEAMKLPAIQIKQLSVPLDFKNRTVALPRYSLRWIDSAMRAAINTDEPGSQNAENVEAHNMRELDTSGIDWGKFKYVFFSEGDQILHVRQASGLYDALDVGQGKIVAVPHRMQVQNSII
jgi:hypothetical protein